MNYKLSTEIKWMFIGNILLSILGIFLNKDIFIVGTAIIFVILSVSVQILMAVADLKAES